MTGVVKIPKPDAHYVPIGLPFRQCFQCRYFNPDEKTCDVVEGEINPKAGCAVFQPEQTPFELLRGESS